MITIAGLSKYYKEDIALENIYLTFKPGEIVGIFGENGSGKTTLLKSIVGLCEKNAGEITLDDKPIKNKAFEKICFTSASGSYYPKLTIEEHKNFFKNFYPKFCEETFDKLAELYNLPSNKKASALSFGQKANLDMCIALSKKCDYILMDEPFLGKDAFTRRDLLKLIISMQTNNECYIIATHQITEIENFITRAIILKKGKVVADKQMDILEDEGMSLLDLIKSIYDYDEQKISSIFLHGYYE